MRQAEQGSLFPAGGTMPRPLLMRVPVGRFRGWRWEDVPIWALRRLADHPRAGFDAETEIARRLEVYYGLDDDGREALVDAWERTHPRVRW
jgi:hypothetical protein